MVSTRRSTRGNPAKEAEDIFGTDRIVDSKNESMDEDDFSEQDDTSVPLKRARSNRASAKSERKKQVRGRQGGLRDFMQIPVEIFTEITYLLNPSDLVSLSRANKFFRGLLLKRSTSSIWQHALNNLPGLPPCPEDMCEPQYAALVFSKFCTLCGANAPARPDMDLRARFCTSCRDTRIKVLSPRRHQIPVDLQLLHTSSFNRPKKAKSQSRTPIDAIFVWDQEVDEILERQEEFRLAGDENGLAIWEANRRKEVRARRTFALDVIEYLKDAEASRGEDLEAIKQQRRNTILGRLSALNWTDTDMTFKGAMSKPWHALVDAPKPLTDRIWANILPKLTQMLEENREQHIAQAKKERRIERRVRVDDFLLNMKYKAHPFEPIFVALGSPTPPPPNTKNRSSTVGRTTLSLVRPVVPSPLPKPQTVLEWDFMKDLSDIDMSIQEVAAHLEDRKSQIEAEVLSWRNSVEERLVKIFCSETDQSQTAFFVVNGDADLSAQFSQNVRLLLRADTIFKKEPVSPALKRLFYYPNIVSSFLDYLNETTTYAHLHPLQETDLNQFSRDIEAEQVVKLMLLELGMSDVSHIELEVLKNRFVCGRCGDKEPKSWVNMVKHHFYEIYAYNAQANHTHHGLVRYPIVIRNIHDCGFADNQQPLVRLLSKEEANRMTSLVTSLLDYDAPIKPRCYLCEGTGRVVTQLSKEDMLLHLELVHGIVESVYEVHYGTLCQRFNDNDWHKDWNAFHDAHVAATRTSMPTSTTA